MDNNFQIKTFGCKVNSYDAGLIEKRLRDVGLNECLTHQKDDPKVIVFNTCAVTEEATKEALRSIRKAKRDYPNAKIMVTGCAAQVDTQVFVDHSDVDAIVANSHKAQIASVAQNLINNRPQEKLLKSNIFKIEDLEEGGGQESSHTRSFLKIQDGCNSFCTYCVIPFARGKSRSIPIKNIVQKINALHDSGINEVVITGIHIADYEDIEIKNSSRGLVDLLKTLLLKTTMPRFRVSSLEPLELNDELLELYQDQRMCPHFHMSIQSVEDEVLKNMKRNYKAQDVLNILENIHKKVPNAYIGMDIIVGFPGETNQQFQNIYKRLSDAPWTKIHSFPYSERPGTFATRLENKWPRHLIMQRSKKLRDLSFDRIQTRTTHQLGLNKNVLVLNSKDNVLRGLSQDNWNIEIQNPELKEIKPGSLLKLRVSELKESGLIGQIQ